MRVRAPWLVLLAVLVVVPDHGTTLVRLSLSQLCCASTLIVRGLATRQECGWNAQHSRVVTLTTFAVEAVEKGSAGKTVVVEQPGGVQGNVQMRVDGTARFYPLARYVLFLEPDRATPGRFLPVGMMQGAFRIYRDAGSGMEHVMPPVPGELRNVRVTGAEPTLSQFETSLRRILGSPLQIPRGVRLRVMLAPSLDQREGGATASAGGLIPAAPHRCPGERNRRASNRRAVEALTMETIFPSSNLVIPAQSVLLGEACRGQRGWRIQWTSLEMGGEKAKFAGVSDLRGKSWPAGSALSVVAE